MTNPTRVTVKNTSNRATGFALTALHTTSAKTAFFSKKYNKYVTETPVSEMAIVKPNGAATLLLNTSGVNIASSETVIALMVNAMQVVYKRHVFDEGHVRNETILVTDVKTDSWITNGKKKISINSQQLLEFPNDFIHGLTMPESHQGVNYYNLIAYMRACERIYEYAAEQVQFPASYFDPNYISQLAPKEMDNLYTFIMKQFNQKHIPMPVGLSGLLNCGKYNFIAKGLVQIALSIVMLLIPGSEAATLSSVASDVGTTLQSVVDNSIAIGKGVDSLKAKNKKV